MVACDVFCLFVISGGFVLAGGAFPRPFFAQGCHARGVIGARMDARAPVIYYAVQI